MATISIQTYDRENKPTSMSIGADDAVTGLNVQALADAIDAIVLGTAVSAKTIISTIVDAGTPGPSAEAFAQRGNKWLLRVSVPLDKQGDGDIYTHEIGTADNAQLPSTDSDFLDLTAGVGAALKTALETVYESPEGNPGTLLSVQQVNRSSN